MSSYYYSRLYPSQGRGTFASAQPCRIQQAADACFRVRRSIEGPHRRGSLDVLQALSTVAIQQTLKMTENYRLHTSKETEKEANPSEKSQTTG